MTGYLISLAFTLIACAVFVWYWIRRFDREARERMARRDAAAAAEAERFEVRRREWDESQARADAEYKGGIASIDRPFTTTQLRAGPELTITMTLNPPATADGPVEVARIRIPISPTQTDAQVSRAIAEFDEVGRRLTVGG